MRKFNVILLFFVLSTTAFSQSKSCDKAAIDKSYSYAVIYGGVKSLIDKPANSEYFKDDYFNYLLKKIILDRKISDKEKVQMFYLMQKKIGFAFSGVSYIPPDQNYFINYKGKIYTYQKTQVALKELNYSPASFLNMAEQYRTSDPILASNALLLGTLINADSALKRLHNFSKEIVIKEAKNANIFNHYLCISAGLVQDSIVTKNLLKNLTAFTNSDYVEDALCALYSKNNPLSLLKAYILNEKNEKNKLSIQTALNILASKLSENSFASTTQNIRKSVTEKWKIDLISAILDKKYIADYGLSSKNKVVTKVWEGVTTQTCPTGLLITNGTLVEFDEN